MLDVNITNMKDFSYVEFGTMIPLILPNVLSNYGDRTQLDS